MKLATAIEFYIEKFMSIMHLYLEGTDSSGTSTELNMGASEMATNNLLGEDDMLALGGEDDDDATGTKITQEDQLVAVNQPASPTQGILDLFTVPSARPADSQPPIGPPA